MFQLINSRKVEELLARGRSARAADVAAGLITQPIRRSATDAVWPLHEIEMLAAAWAAGKSADDIKALVKELHAERASLLDAVRKAA